MLYDHRQVEQRKRELSSVPDRARYHKYPLAFIGLGIAFLFASALL